jgi:hypothetical protein
MIKRRRYPATEQAKKWNNGRMEYGNDGQKMLKPIIPSFQYSNFFTLKMTRIIVPVP